MSLSRIQSTSEFGEVEVLESIDAFDAARTPCQDMMDESTPPLYQRLDTSMFTDDQIQDGEPIPFSLFASVHELVFQCMVSLCVSLCDHLTLAPSKCVFFFAQGKESPCAK